MEPVAWHGSQGLITAGASVGVAFMGIATDQWIIIAAGLGVGVMARAAYLLSLRKPVLRDFAISLVVAPMNGALAAEMVDTLALHDSRLLLATALLGSSSTMAFMGARQQFLRWHGAQREPAQIFADPDTVTHVPPKSRAVDVRAVGPSAAQTPSDVEREQLAAQPPVETPDKRMEALLRRLDEDS